MSLVPWWSDALSCFPTPALCGSHSSIYGIQICARKETPSVWCLIEMIETRIMVIEIRIMVIETRIETKEVKGRYSLLLCLN